MTNVTEGAEKRNGLRLVSNVFSLAQFCDRASCKRAKRCKGNAERCLAIYSECVPREAREFVVDLMVSRELGYSFEEELRRDREGARAFAAWNAKNVLAPKRSSSFENLSDTAISELIRSQI